MLKQLRRQRGKSGKEMIVRDKTGSSDCSNHRIDATETQRVPHLGGEIGVEYQGKLFFFFFLTRDYTEIYLKVQSIQYRYLGDMFHWWETNLVLHIIRTTMMFKLFHMQPNKKTQFRPATQAVQELCFQGCAVVEVTAPSWQEV